MSISAAPTQHALPADWYADPRQARDERNAIFRRTWQVAGFARDVAEPGSFFAGEVAGVPVVVTRDRHNELHALLNVCPHRGMVVAHGCGPAKLLQCPNHAWVFTLSGALRSAPRADAEPAFRAEGLGLRALGVHQWGPLVLVCLDPDVPPPSRELDVVRSSIEAYGLDVDTLEPAGAPFEWDIAANWKILVENYLECYHCPLVHPDFCRVFDVAQDRYAHRPDGALLSASAPVRATPRIEAQQAILSTAGAVTDSHWHLLFPASTINVYPGEGAVEVTWYWPTGPESSRGRTLLFHPPGASDAYAAQVRELSLTVGAEDNALCEGMQRGMGSGMLERATLMPENERLLIAFQRLVREALDIS